MAACDLNGKSDPYVKIKTDKMEKALKTKVIKTTLNPVWNYSFTVSAATA